MALISKFSYSIALSVCANIVVAQTPTVQQITPSNAQRLIQKGPDATGGIGDWHLSNGTLCATISDINHESELSTKGGGLIDLGFCGRDDDHYTFSQDLIDGKRTRPLDTYSISTASTSDSASVFVKSAENGIEQITKYHVKNSAPTVLFVSKTLTRLTDVDNKFNVFTAVNFNYHSLEPFVFSSKDIKNSNGFTHQDFVSRGVSALPDAARNADTIISISPPSANTPISYGWQSRLATRTNGNDSYAIPRFALADDSSNTFLYVPDTFYIGDGSYIGWLQLVQIPFLSLDLNASLQIEEVIYIGKNGDVASITDQLLNDTVNVIGRVSETNSAIHIDDMNGTPITHIRPQADGSFSAKLPQGKYQLRHIGSADRLVKRDIIVDQKNNDIGELKLPAVNRLELPKGQAMRLVFKGLNGTPDPNFIDTFTQMSVKEEDGIHFNERNSQVFLAGIKGDLSHVTLANGDYRVYATRGPEYSLEQTDMSINGSENQKLTIKTPRHLLPTPGFIASDLHVHSGAGFDNSFSDAERVRTFVAEHGEVLVSSEHDLPIDFSPLISSMGVGDKITSIAAAEITSLLPSERLPHTGGHFNVFPYQPRHHEFRNGMVNHENRRLRETIDDVRQLEPNALFQLNHPRTNLSLSGDLPDNHDELIDDAHYLEHMGVASFPYNPEKPLHTHPNNTLIDKDPRTGLRDIDFDLIELINPGGPEHQERLQAVRKDWLSFLKQGEIIVATANSDSHSSLNQVAVPRTMVAIKDDRVGVFNQNEFLRSLKSGNAYGTTGPMMEINLSGVSMGETHRGNKAVLNLKIASLDWVTLDSALIQVNGDTVKEFSLHNKAINNVVKQTISLPMEFEDDAFVTVEIIGKASSDYQIIYPEISPYAFSNAIFVDANADGQWQAPGL